MTSLPGAQIPLNQHSLGSIELWLNELGAKKSTNDPCLWLLKTVNWSAEIKIEQDELRVVWEKDGKRNQCCFSYGLSRQDIEFAMMQGP